MLVDPDGRDAKVIINNDENTITIQANLIISGEKATPELAEKYKQDIMKNWGSIKEYDDGDNIYEVNWEINVRVKEKGEKENYNGVNNYIKVFDKKRSDGGTRSYVMGSNKGEFRCNNLEKGNPASHEFGHILGLLDRYEKNGSPMVGWHGNIMAEPAGRGDRKSVV